MPADELGPRMDAELAVYRGQMALDRTYRGIQRGGDFPVTHAGGEQIGDPALGVGERGPAAATATELLEHEAGEAGVGRRVELGEAIQRRLNGRPGLRAGLTPTLYPPQRKEAQPALQRER